MQNNAVLACRQRMPQKLPCSPCRAQAWLLHQRRPQLLPLLACRRRTTSRAHSRPSSRAVSSSGMAAPSNGTIAQKCQQLEREVAKLKAYAARQAGTETARPPKPRSVRGDLRKTAGVAKTARVVRTSPDGDEGVSPYLNKSDVHTTISLLLCGAGVVTLQSAACGGQCSSGAAEWCLSAA